MRRLRFAIPFSLLALALAPSPSAAVGPPARYTLPNGLSVVLDPMPARRSVAVVVSVEAGRRDQPEGWSGLAHLTEHLLFQGTPAAPGELITRLERLGASDINGQTSDDWTRYHEVVPRAQLERTLWLEAERFAHGLDGLDPRAGSPSSSASSTASASSAISGARPCGSSSAACSTRRATRTARRTSARVTCTRRASPTCAGSFSVTTCPIA